MKKAKGNTEVNEPDNKITDNLADQETLNKENQEILSDTAEVSENPADASLESEMGESETFSAAAYENQITELKDKYLRLSAEFDNYRRRTLKEKMDLAKYAGEDLLKSLLPVIDDFERGIKNLEQANDMEAVKSGIFLIYNKFKEFISQKGLKEIDTQSNEFNTDFHEAITKIPVENKDLSGKIIDVVQKGYMLDEKVVRYSKVVIGE